jgi:hypothetical protein
MPYAIPIHTNSPLLLLLLPRVHPLTDRRSNRYVLIGCSCCCRCSNLQPNPMAAGLRVNSTATESMSMECSGQSATWS